MKVLVILALILGFIYFFKGKKPRNPSTKASVREIGERLYLSLDDACSVHNDIKACCTLGLEMAEIRKRYKGSIESLRIMGCDV